MFRRTDTIAVARAQTETKSPGIGSAALVACRSAAFDSDHESAAAMPSFRDPSKASHQRKQNRAAARSKRRIHGLHGTNKVFGIGEAEAQLRDGLRPGQHVHRRQHVTAAVELEMWFAINVEGPNGPVDGCQVVASQKEKCKRCYGEYDRGLDPNVGWTKGDEVAG